MGKLALKGQKHWVLELLPLRGAFLGNIENPGRCPGLTAFCPFGAFLTPPYNKGEVKEHYIEVL